MKEKTGKRSFFNYLVNSKEFLEATNEETQAGELKVYLWIVVIMIIFTLFYLLTSLLSKMGA